MVEQRNWQRKGEETTVEQKEKNERARTKKADRELQMS